MPSSRRLTYAQSGVDIKRGDRASQSAVDSARKTHDRRVLSNDGGFGALFHLKNAKGKSFKDPVLVSATDGVGTKLKLAFQLKKHDSVGIDLVAMSVNDLVACGARPLFFLDYYAASTIDPKAVKQVVGGIADGCQSAGCALVGGETAEMAGFYAKNEYDMAGFAVGVAEKSHIVAGQKSKQGEVLIGLPASGLHSNGFSLVRAIIKKKKLNLRKKIAGHNLPLGQQLLEPTKLYSPLIPDVLDHLGKQRGVVTGLAHITGGGLPGNVKRLLAPGHQAVIETGSWVVPDLFKELAVWGSIRPQEMFRTFNMGIGFVLACKKKSVQAVLRALTLHGARPTIIGHIEKGKSRVVIKRPAQALNS